MLVTAALTAAVTAAGCTSASPRTSRQTSSESSASPAPCSVTRSSGLQPPRVARLNFGEVLTTSKIGWVGSGGLWTQLPTDGVLFVIKDQADGLYRAKFGWFRALPGQVRVTGRPAAGPSATFRADVGTVPEYGATGFTPSILQFSRLGCWELTGALGKGRLTLVMFVKPWSPPP